MTPDQILSLITHGGPAAMAGLLFWLYMKERAERQAAQALVLSMVKEVATSTAQMANAFADNTRATNTVSTRLQDLGDKLSTLVSRRKTQL